MKVIIGDEHLAGQELYCDCGTYIEYGREKPNYCPNCGRELLKNDDE